MALGEILRDARTRKGWSVAQVAEATRMMVQIVEELEREDFRRIAAPIYGRGFIKLYAEHVGIDPDPLIQEFIEIYTGARAPVVARRPVAPAEHSPAPEVAPAPAAAAAPVVIPAPVIAPAPVPVPVPAPVAKPVPAVKPNPVERTVESRTQVRSAPAVAPLPADPAPVQPVMPIEEPVPAPEEDDLFAAANRRPSPVNRPAASDGLPPKASPVGVRAIRRPMPLPRPAMPAAVPAAASSASPQTGGWTPCAITTVKAGLKRLWGGVSLTNGWLTRRHILLAAGLVVAALLIFGIRMLLKVTARGAAQGVPSISRPILPPPDPYVD